MFKLGLEAFFIEIEKKFEWFEEICNFEKIESEICNFGKLSRKSANSKIFNDKSEIFPRFKQKVTRALREEDTIIVHLYGFASDTLTRKGRMFEFSAGESGRENFFRQLIQWDHERFLTSLRMSQYHLTFPIAEIRASVDLPV